MQREKIRFQDIRLSYPLSTVCRPTLIGTFIWTFIVCQFAAGSGHDLHSPAIVFGLFFIYNGITMLTLG